MKAHTLLLFLYTFVFLLQIKASLSKGLFQAKLILSFNHFQVLITSAWGQSIRLFPLEVTKKIWLRSNTIRRF